MKTIIHLSDLLIGKFNPDKINHSLHHHILHQLSKTYDNEHLLINPDILKAFNSIYIQTWDKFNEVIHADYFNNVLFSNKYDGKIELESSIHGDYTRMVIRYLSTYNQEFVSEVFHEFNHSVSIDDDSVVSSYCTYYDNNVSIVKNKVKVIRAIESKLSNLKYVIEELLKYHHSSLSPEEIKLRYQDKIEEMLKMYMFNDKPSVCVVVELITLNQEESTYVRVHQFNSSYLNNRSTYSLLLDKIS